MAELSDRSNRQTIPRWLPSTNTRLFSQGNSIKKAVSHSEIHLEQSIQKWKVNKSLHNAIDLVARNNLIEGCPEAIAHDSANFILNNEPIVSTEVIKAARYTLGMQSTESPSATTKASSLTSNISNLRDLRNKYPTDAFIWCDLAFYHAAIGNDDEALKSMLTAIHLAPDSTLIARSYSRLLVHLKHEKQAVAFLRKIKTIKSNPLLMSVEISIRERFNLGGIQVSPARKLIEHSGLHPRLLSELQSALGTLELNAGKTKVAKRLIESSLTAPTENSFTQAVWLSETAKINMEVNYENSIQSSEAQAIKLFFAEKYDDCINKLKEFYYYQPFSEAPIVDATYLKLICQNDPNGVLKLAEEVGVNQNSSFKLKNNVAVAALLSGKVDKAEYFLSSVSHTNLTDEERIILKATTGLYCFKVGMLNEGRTLYEDTLKHLTQLGKKRNLALAQYFYALAEKDVDIQRSKTIASTAKKIAENIEYKELVGPIDSLLGN